MKKSLIFSVAIAATLSAFAGTPSFRQSDKYNFSVGPQAPALSNHALTRADGAMESFDFTYAEEPYTALNLKSGGGSSVYMLFEMTADDIKTFAGSQVTGFTVYGPTDYNGTKNSITEGRFFYTTDLSKEDYSQNFSIKKTPFGANVVTIDTPYTITGEEKSLYFGYSIVTPKKDDMYYVVVDYIANAPNSCIIGVSDKVDSMPSEYEAIGESYGALCMSVKLERENLPQFASFYSVPSVFCLPLGKEVSIPVAVKSTSGAPVESLEIEYTLAGKLYTSKSEFSKPISAGAGRYININIDFPAQSKKLNEQVEFKITKINGNVNNAVGDVVEATVVVVDEVPVHQTLYEEYTGTWCGFCTRGYAALEYIRKNYPEFVVAAFHGDDPMQITNSFPTDVPGFPSAVLNRSAIIDPYFGTSSYDTELPIVGDILALNAIPTAWSVEVAHTWESDDVLVAKAEVANMAGFENQTYKIAYLLVADGLSGKSRSWFQSNNYASNSQSPEFIPELNAFCKGGEYGKSKVAGLVFNDVVISSTGIFGEEGSIPRSLEPEQTAEHMISFDLSKIPADLLPDKNKLRVIAAVVDQSGVVQNCAKDEVNDYGFTGVAGVIDENAPAEYYNLSGQKVSKPSNGIFIRRQGSNATKVIIR